MSEYIDRETVLAEIKRYKDLFCECDYAFETLENNLPLPAADVAPIFHAHWTNKERYHSTLFGDCSNCGMSSVADAYCSNCGAKMDEEVSE